MADDKQQVTITPEMAAQVLAGQPTEPAPLPHIAPNPDLAAMRGPAPMVAASMAPTPTVEKIADDTPVPELVHGIIKQDRKERRDVHYMMRSLAGDQSQGNATPNAQAAKLGKILGSKKFVALGLLVIVMVAIGALWGRLTARSSNSNAGPTTVTIIDPTKMDTSGSTVAEQAAADPFLGQMMVTDGWQVTSRPVELSWPSAAGGFEIDFQELRIVATRYFTSSQDHDYGTLEVLNNLSRHNYVIYKAASDDWSLYRGDEYVVAVQMTDDYVSLINLESLSENVARENEQQIAWLLAQEKPEVTALRADTVLLEILQKLGWYEVSETAVEVRWQLEGAGYEDVYKNENALTIAHDYGEGNTAVDGAAERIEKLLRESSYRVDERSLASDKQTLYTDGHELIVVTSDAGKLSVSRVGKVAEWAAIETADRLFMTTNPLMVRAASVSKKWWVTRGVGITWARTDAAFARTTSFVYADGEAMGIVEEVIGESEFNSHYNMLKKALTNSGFELDPSRKWSYTYCGGETFSDLYTDGNEIALVGYAKNDDEQYTAAKRPHTLWLYVVGTVADLEKVELSNQVTARVLGQTDDWQENSRRFVAGVPVRNPYAPDERYAVALETHCGDNPFYYYYVENGVPQVLAAGMTSGVSAQTCQEWTDDPYLDDDDWQFLYETYCETADNERKPKIGVTE